MREQTADASNGEKDRGTGLMFVVLIAGALMCVGSIGGAIFFVWNAARNARDREMEAATAARVAAEQSVRTGDTERFEVIARAMAARLDSPEGLRDSYTADGKPLLSWRVHLLPYIAQADLHKQFKLNEPWDSPTNRDLIAKIPTAYDYSGPRAEGLHGWTYVRGFSQPGAIFEPKAQFTRKDLSPGPDQILAIFDSADPVEWTKPDILGWKDQSTLPPVGGSHPDRPKFLAATASGRVVWIDRAIQPDVLWQISARRHGPAWDDLARRWMD